MTLQEAAAYFRVDVSCVRFDNGRLIVRIRADRRDLLTGDQTFALETLRQAEGMVAKTPKSKTAKADAIDHATTIWIDACAKSRGEERNGVFFDGFFYSISEQDGPLMALFPTAPRKLRERLVKKAQAMGTSLQSMLSSISRHNASTLPEALAGISYEFSKRVRVTRGQRIAPRPVRKPDWYCEGEEPIWGLVQIWPRGRTLVMTSRGEAEHFLYPSFRREFIAAQEAEGEAIANRFNSAPREPHQYFTAQDQVDARTFLAMEADGRFQAKEVAA